MKLEWVGTGPATTQELAAEVRRERRLGRGLYVSKDGLRCLWGVIYNRSYSKEWSEERTLTSNSVSGLHQAGLSSGANDAFPGTPEERCEEMARRLEAIP